MGSMQDFNQFLDIELEDYRTLKDPYEVERRAVRGDGDSEGTEVYPLRISEDKVLMMYNKALEDNKCAPCSAIYTTGLQSGLMAYEVANARARDNDDGASVGPKSVSPSRTRTAGADQCSGVVG